MYLGISNATMYYLLIQLSKGQLSSLLRFLKGKVREKYVNETWLDSPGVDSFNDWSLNTEFWSFHLNKMILILSYTRHIRHIHHLFSDKARGILIFQSRSFLCYPNKRIRGFKEVPFTLEKPQATLEIQPEDQKVQKMTPANKCPIWT